MLGLWTRRTQQPEPARIESPEPSTVIRTDLSHVVERKIHPDLNSLAEEISSQRDSGSTQVSEQVPVDAFQSESAGFVGLEPSTRLRRASLKEERKEDKRASTSALASPSRFGEKKGPSQLEVPQGDKEPSLEKGLEAQLIERDTHDPSSIPVQFVNVSHSDIRPGDGHTEFAGLRRWPTFGRRHGVGRRPSTSNTVHSVERSASQSSLSQPRSRNTSHSYFTSDNQPRTPGTPAHPHSLYTSTPYSRRETTSQSESDREPLPSPHTFGMPTPPQQGSHSRRESYFREAPPPLPPLDHPAFRLPVDEFGVLPDTRHFHVGQESVKAARHSHSLPTIAQSQKSTSKTENAKDASKSSKTRGRSKSTVESVQEGPRSDTVQVQRILHSRNQSKTSVASSSRRSSAEYSARQASSLGHSGCWEVDVSKAMISLALGEGQGTETRPSPSNPPSTHSSATLAFPGKARGYNRPSGEVVALGSPFFLQDPTAHNLIDNRLSNDHYTSAKSRYPVQTSKSSSAVEKSARDVLIMIHGETQGSVTPITSASTNPTTSAKRQEALSSSTSSPKSTNSRRGGRRTNSGHSKTRSPSPPPPKKVHTTQSLGSVRGSSSLLAPPQLSVTAPTPEASPISPSTPTRRTHHKSTPTMPQKSMLPPVIEKSYSSGSAKRKADEAGVGGDKTPPKDNKEPRATFAPEPRAHRASATSSSGHAPSSFNRSKRVRLTESSDGGRGSTSRSGSRAGTLGGLEDSPPNAKNTGSWSSSRGSHAPMSASSHTHREASFRDGPPVALSASHGRASSRRSLSQASIPLSALVSPHAPSVSNSGTFHMRDPRKPHPVQSTPWSLSFPSQVQHGESRWGFHGWVERGGSPLHAWLFFIGFIIFPLWWAAALCIPIPRTRRLGGTDAEKGVILDDPQVEHDAKSWRLRCRVMAGVSLLTYIPFIVLVAIYA